MTTKEQERKALDQIRKIIAGLGEGSYLATAFDGCIEDAERNIEDDAAYSWKDRAVTALRKENDALVKVDAARELLTGKDAEIKALEEKIGRIEKENAQLRSDLQGSKENAIQHWNQFREEQQKTEAQATEIMRLKARLFDLLCKE